MTTLSLGEVDLSDIPQGLSNQLNLPLFASQVLCTAILFMIFVMPIVLIKKRKGIFAELIMSILVLSFSVGIGWLHYSIMLIIVLLLSVILSMKFKDWLG